MTDRRATLRPRLKHLEAESINWPADFWRDPSAWQALGTLLENGPGAMRAAVSLAEAGDHAGLSQMLELAIGRTYHEITLTRARLAWAREAVTRKSEAWRATDWWAQPETIVGASSWLASLALVAEHGLDRIDDLHVTPALLARVLPAGLAEKLRDLENLP
jgi:hypothetical protein